MRNKIILCSVLGMFFAFGSPAFSEEPLEKAVEANNMELAVALIEAGANPNNGTYPPLYLAIKNNNMPMAKLLLKNGANPNKGRGSDLALLGAAKYSTEIGLMLLESGKVDVVNFRTYDGLTLLSEIANTGNHKIAMKMLDLGAKPVQKTTPDYQNRWNINQFKSIIRAIDKKDTTMVRLMIAYGGSEAANAWCCETADANSRNSCTEKYTGSHSPLFFEALRMFSSSKIVATYIDAGFDVGAIDNVTGNNALHVLAGKKSASSEDLESIKLLVNAGVSLKNKNKQNLTPLLLAMSDRSSKQVMDLLKSLAATTAN